MRLVFAAIALAFILLSCGTTKKVPGGGDTPPPPPAVARVQLVVFGAPPCSNCHRDFPLLQDEIGKLGLKPYEVALTMYVETGVRWVDPPTPDIASAYRDSLHVTVFSSLPDGVKNGRPSYEAFTRYTGIPLASAALPAGALVVEGKVTKVYQAGGISFSPAVIAQDLKAALRSR